MYDSLLAGKVGEWIMSIEEEGVDELGYIPENSRVWGENIELDLQRRRAKIRCRQNYADLQTGEMRWRWRENDVFW